MYIQQIIVPDDTYYMDIPCTLLEATYILTMRYNTRSNSWMGDLSDVAGNVIVGGFPFRTGISLWDPYYRSTQVPKGILMVVDNTGKLTDPGKDSFASTHSLYFIVP